MHCIERRLDQLAAQGIATLRPVELDARDAVADLQHDRRGRRWMSEREGIDHVAGVFANCRRAGVECHHLAIKAHRTAHRAGLHAIGQGHRLHELQVGGLRVGQRLLIAVDRRARHSGRRKAPEPVRGGVMDKARLKQVAQIGLIGGSQGGRGKARLSQQLGCAGDLADLLPELVVAGGNRKPAVLRAKGLIGRIARMRRAELAGIAPGAEILARLQRRHRDRGGEHRHIQMAAGPAGAHSRDHGRDRKSTIKAGAEIHQRHTGLDRCALGFTGHAHDTRCRLDGEVESAFSAARAVLAEGRDRAVDERGLARAEPVPAQTEPGHGSRTVVLDHHIACHHQLAGEVARGGVFQVERDRALAPVDRGKVFTEASVVGARFVVAMADRWPLPHGVAIEWLDLGDLGAVIGQQHAAKGACGNMAELDRENTGKRQGYSTGHQLSCFMPIALSRSA